MNLETLIKSLSKMFGQRIVRAEYQTEQLQGGTLGDVQLVSGMAETADGEKKPYRIVWKTQKQWERPGDPNSWLREYDLYKSDINAVFTDSFRRPECYLAERNENEIQLWMEYIDGESGSDLTVEMLEQAAQELGRFQGRLYMQSDTLKEASCLGDIGFMQREHDQWHTQTFTYDFLISAPCRMPEFLKQMLKDNEIQLCEGKSFEYSCLRSTGCTLPTHLKQMLLDMDDRRDEIFNQIKLLPVVLCHRDYWIENIFHSGGKIRLIDWDTAGWGYMGEDIASLIVDDTEPSFIDEYCRRLVPAYLKGISEYMDLSHIENFHIRDMIIIKFGYRYFQRHMFSQSPDVKNHQIAILQKIYEMKN